MSMQNSETSNILNVLNNATQNISDGVKNISENIQENIKNISESLPLSMSLTNEQEKKDEEEKKDSEELQNKDSEELQNKEEKKDVVKRHKKKLRIVKNYYKGMLCKQIQIHIKYINANLMQHLNELVNRNYSGKCIVEGYVKNKSCEILTYSSGEIDGEMVNMNVVFNCLICNPVEGMLIDCVVKNITKAGIRAEINEAKTPMVLFVSRDHNINVNAFNKINIEDKIKVRVIGTRFELNDEYISVIGELKS